jgi:hypothetical protein
MALYLGSNKKSKANVVTIHGAVSMPNLSNPGNAASLLEDKQLIDQNGNIVTGTMSDNGSVSQTLDLDNLNYNVPQGYTDGGTVSIDDAIPTEVANQADLISQIQAALEDKADYVTVYIGSSQPTSDIGSDGDFYIVRE